MVYITWAGKEDSLVWGQVHCQVLVDSRIVTGWVRGKSPPAAPPPGGGGEEAVAVTFANLSREGQVKSGVSQA